MSIINSPIFGFPNFFDSTYSSTTQIAPVIGGGSWSTTRPLTNLKESELALTARSESAATADTEFFVDLGIQRDVGVIAIPKHNLSRSSQIRFCASNTVSWSGVTISGAHSAGATSLSVSSSASMGSNEVFKIAGDTTVYKITNVTTGQINITPALASAKLGGEALTCHSGDFSSPLHDTGFTDVWEEIYEFGALPWGHPALWDLKATEEDAQNITIPYAYVPSSNVIARYLKFEISDAGNADGYISLNRLMITRAIQPTYGIAYGAELDYYTDTRRVSSRGGADTYDVERVGRIYRFNINNLTIDDALVNFSDMISDAGIDKEIFFIFDKSDTIHKHRRWFMGRMSQLSTQSITAWDNVDSTHEIKEVLA